MIRIFPPEFHYYTPTGKINFLGAVKETFEIINAKVSEPVKNDYYAAYINRIFPIFDPSISIDDYDDDLISSKISQLQTHRAVNETTIKSDYRHLIVDPIVTYQKNNFQDYKEISSWGNAYKFHEKNGENLESTVALIPKSFDEETDKKAKSYFLSCEKENGETFGLAIMYFIGARENEICGLDFSDVFEMTSHPDCHFIISGYQTTGENTNQLEAGGKTGNSERRTPIEQETYELIKRRMDYIEKEIGESCLNYPIACRGSRFNVRCSTIDLSMAGRRFFRDILHIRENDLAGISIELSKLNNSPFKEEDATTYLFRRNFATRNGILRNDNDKNCLSLADLQYLQSHKIDDPNVTRWDYNDDEVLYKLYLKMYGGNK